MTTFTFNNRETYLAYRSNWKAEYKALSEEIRDKKWMNKEYQRAWNSALAKHGHPFNRTNNIDAFFDHIKATLGENKRYQELKTKYGNKNDTIHYMLPLKMKATAMIEELTEAKQEAQRQYLAQKEQLAIA